MTSVNIYKPRYKITWQSKSKIWPYKNSRLRRFFNIRGRKLVRRGLFKRVVLVFNNMKWTIARRYIRPYMKKRRPLRRRFKNVFYSKQQLKAFYGKEKEEIFRNFFKRFLGGAKNRNNMFVTALERRTDIFLFRLRFLPTIYACRQFILHYGLTINRRLEHSPSAQILPGDIISLKKKHWLPFVESIYERIYWRAYGLDIWKKRQFKMLRKKAWWCYKNKPFQKGNVLLLRKQRIHLHNFLKTVNNFQQYFPNFFKKTRNLINYINRKKMNSNNLTNEELFLYNKVVELEKNSKTIWFDFKVKLRLFLQQISKIQKKAWFLRFWKLRSYYSKFLQLLNVIFKSYKFIYSYIKQFRILENEFYSYTFKHFLNLKIKDLSNEILGLNFKLKEIQGTKNKIKFELNIINSELEVVRGKKIKLQEIILNMKNKEYQNLSKNINIKEDNNGKIYMLDLEILNVQFTDLNYVEHNLVSKKEKYLKLLNVTESEFNQLLNYYQCFKSEKSNPTLSTYVKIDFKKFQEAKKDVSANFSFKTISALDFIEKKTKEIKLFKKLLPLDFNDLNNESFDYLNTNIKTLSTLLLKNRIKRYTVRPRSFLDIKTKKPIYRRSPILYFLMARKFKSKRRQSIQRLRSVHWYVPSYIYFDFRTLRAVYLYNPKPEEIVFSFKCSLPQIYSFYRTLGY